MDIKWIFCVVTVVLTAQLATHQGVHGFLRRCINCRSRGELGSCKDPFTMNTTLIENEHGVEAIPCASGWCGKIIEAPNLNNVYGTATQRMCLQRGPDDGEERCAYTMKNYKNVYMCFCRGDLCNHGGSLTIPSLLLILIMSTGALSISGDSVL